MVASKLPKIVSREDFKAVVCPEAVARSLVMEAHIPQTEANWFITLASFRVRWFYTYNKTWKGQIDSNDECRDFLHRWIGHWLKAYLKDRVAFRADMNKRFSEYPEWVVAEFKT